MKRILAVGAVLAALAAPAAASAATSGAYLSVSGAKLMIRGELSFYQVGTQWATKIHLCYKPTYDSVKCYWQMREWIPNYGWNFCYGTATARDQWDWIHVKLRRGWIDDCYLTVGRPAFL